jgi:hypothetical protein
MASFHPGWLELESAAFVDVTSEDKSHPIESALLDLQEHGCRAAEPGKQSFRLIFDERKVLRRIQLIFEETGVSILLCKRLWFCFWMGLQGKVLLPLPIPDPCRRPALS